MFLRVAHGEHKMSYSTQYCYHYSDNGSTSLDLYIYPVKYYIPSSIHCIFVTNIFLQVFFSTYSFALGNITVMILLMKELSIISHASQLLRILQMNAKSFVSYFCSDYNTVYNIWSFPKFITNESLLAAGIALNLS